MFKVGDKVDIIRGSAIGEIGTIVRLKSGIDAVDVLMENGLVYGKYYTSIRPYRTSIIQRKLISASKGAK